MALAEVIKTECANIAIWHITEKVDELENLFTNRSIVEGIKEEYSNEKRQCETLISHLLIKHILGEERVIKHHPNGAPYVDDMEDKYISISHSRKSIAVAISPKPIGIDIEEIDRKQYSLHKKFTTTNEQLWIEGSDNKQLISAIIWSAKEAIYKLANIEGLLFESEIEINPFPPQSESTFKASYLNNSTTNNLFLTDKEILVVSGQLLDQLVVSQKK